MNRAAAFLAGALAVAAAPPGGRRARRRRPGPPPAGGRSARRSSVGPDAALEGSLEVAQEGRRGAGRPGAGLRALPRRHRGEALREAARGDRRRCRS